MAHQATSSIHHEPTEPMVGKQLAGEFAHLAGMAHWILRIALAGVFIYHGYSKFTGLEQFSNMMHLSFVTAVFVALAETVGAALILIGGIYKDWMTRLGAAMIIPVMIGAISMVHWGQWSFVPSATHPMGGMEFQVTLLLISLYFLVKGNKA